MKFESVIDVEVRPGNDPDSVAVALAGLIYKARRRLSHIAIQVRPNGKKYSDTGHGFDVSPDEEGLPDEQLRATARDLADAIAETCAMKQADYSGPVFWNVVGYDQPQKGEPKELFSHRFQIESLHPASLKETETSALMESNKLLRAIAEDSHKRHMEMADKAGELIGRTIAMVTPVADMTAAMADRLRPSDAEIKHRTHMAEMELRAAVAQAEAEGKESRSKHANQTIRGLFERVPFDDLGRAAASTAESWREKNAAAKIEQRRMDRQERAEERRQQEERERQDQPEGSNEPHQPEADEPVETTARDTRPQPPTPSPKTFDHLCDGSRTLAELLEDRHDAVEEALGTEEWSLLRDLATHTEQESFDERVRVLVDEYKSRDPTKMFAMLTKLNKALDDEDDWRTDLLGEFLRDIGVFK